MDAFHDPHSGLAAEQVDVGGAADVLVGVGVLADAADVLVGVGVLADGGDVVGAGGVVVLVDITLLNTADVLVPASGQVRLGGGKSFA